MLNFYFLIVTKEMKDERAILGEKHFQTTCGTLAMALLEIL
jgi:hypothetical protein